MLIHGWGRYPVRQAHSATVQSARDVIWQLQSTDHAWLARGAGRSYGDSGLAPHVFDLTPVNGLIRFDSTSGQLECAAGVPLHDVLQVMNRRGWTLPVVPGTAFVTVGGAIASDVHGKNHHIDGCFSAWANSFDLVLGDGRLITCTPRDTPDLWRATCGGMGLTGVIVSAVLQLTPQSCGWIDETSYRTEHLDDTLATFAATADAPWQVAWLDCLASGGRLGRAHISCGRVANTDRPPPSSQKPLTVPFTPPGSWLNRHSLRVFNGLYYHRQRRRVLQRQVPARDWFFPLDRLLHWNRLYGRQGFVQYQCVLPAGEEAGLKALLQRIAASGSGSFLAVLKRLGPGNGNLLSFPMEGYTLALDFRLTAQVLALLHELDGIVLAHGGRVYLTKDARLDPTTFRKMYPQWEALQAVRKHYGALGRFASWQSHRLGLETS